MKRMKNKKAAVKMIAALMVAVFAICGNSKTVQQVYELHANAPCNNIPGLRNFARVSENLYRGAQPTEQGFKELKKMGVKTIINLRSSHSDEKMMGNYGFVYVSIPCKAWHPEDEDVAKFMRIATNPAYQPVFVHCQYGADRTGMMVAAYRIYVQGWTNYDAGKELKKYGFHGIWKDIKNYIEHYEKARIGRLMEQSAKKGV